MWLDTCAWVACNGDQTILYVPGVPFGQLNQQYSLWLVSETNVHTQQRCTVQTGHAQNEGTDHGTCF